MGGTRFELVTFRTSSECSKPTELTAHTVHVIDFLGECSLPAGRQVNQLS